MDDSTPKLRFKISPGSSARLAEQERTGVPPRMRIQGGTAARMAEGEAPLAAQRPYSMSMQARTGKPFTLAEISAMDHSSVPQVQQSAAENQPRDSAIRTRPFRPIPERDKLSAPTGDVPVFEEGALTHQFEKEAQIPPRSPLQTLRDLFSRTLPRQDKKQ